MKKFVKNNKIYIFSLALIFMAGSGLGSINHFPGPIIQWLPSKIEQTQFPGTANILIAKFTSKEDLENVKFWLTPRLSKYATIEPESIEKVEKNKEYMINIIVSLPSDIKTGKTFCERLQDLPKDHTDKMDKDDKDFLFKCPKNKISGLLFVASEKTVPWFKFWHKGKERKIRTIHPRRALKIVIEIKEPSTEEIPFDEVSLPTIERIYEDEETGAVYVEDEVIIGFKEGVSEARIKEIVAGVNGVFLGSISDLDAYQIQILNIIDPSQLEQIIQALEALPEVVIATYSWIDEIR